MAASRKSLKGYLRAWIAALALAAVGTGALASPASALPRNFWGVVPQNTPTLEQLKRLKRGGVESVRLAMVWQFVQMAPGSPFNWTDVDRQIESLALARIDVLPFLSGAPPWIVAPDKRFGSPKTLPVRTGAQRSGWKQFVRQAVQRYGPRGSFWAENPGIPKRPIRTWQVWNEENFFFFVARPNPAEYGKLLKLTYSAIKGVDRGARIILGGLFARPKQATFKRRPPLAYFATDFLDKLYRSTPGVKRKFNGVALHPYTGRYQELKPNIEAVRGVLKKNRDAGKGLWITELGWSSGPVKRNNSFAKGRRGQAAQLKGAFRLLRKYQRKWRINRVYWFAVDDLAGACNFCDGAGLFGEGFVPKPSWKAYVRFAGGRAS